jgi:hypothetical protein
MPCDTQRINSKTGRSLCLLKFSSWSGFTWHVRFPRFRSTKSVLQYHHFYRTKYRGTPLLYRYPLHPIGPVAVPGMYIQVPGDTMEHKFLKLPTSLYIRHDTVPVHLKNPI